MKSRLLLLNVFLIMLAVPGISDALPLTVSPNDETAVFLDRLASRGILTRYLNDTGPLTRREVADGLAEALAASEQLTEHERRLLHFHIRYFYPEMSGRRHESLGDGQTTAWALGGTADVKRSLRHAFRYDPDADPACFMVHEDSLRTAVLHWSESLRSENRSDAHRYLWRDHFNLSLTAGPSFGMYLDATRLIQSYHEDYSEPSEYYRGGFLARLDEGLQYYSYDYSHAYVNWQSGYGNFMFSNAPLQWGNTYNSMLINERALAFPALQWNISFGHGKYSFLHGWLLPGESVRDSVYNNREYLAKYIVAHRYELSPWKRVNVAFTEFIIYGDRPVEPTYLLPMIFLWSAQHNLNDRGNMLMSVEGEWFPVNGLKLYGTFLLDELVLSELLGTWWANKQGYQAGFHLSPRSFPWAGDLRAEISYVRPWTYTHKYDYNTFTHNGQGLGFPYGPNSMYACVEVNAHPSVRQSFSISYTHLLKGVNPLSPGEEGYFPIGDDPNQDYEERNPLYDNATEWIMGDRMLTRKLSLSWRYLLSDLLKFESDLALEKDDSGDIIPYCHFRLAMTY